MSKNTDRDIWIAERMRSALETGRLKYTSKKVAYMRGRPLRIHEKDLEELMRWAWSGGQHQRNQHFEKALRDWKDQS